MAMLESMVLRGLVAEEAKLPLELLQGYIFFTIMKSSLTCIKNRTKRKFKRKNIFKIFNTVIQVEIKRIRNTEEVMEGLGLNSRRF